MHSSRVGSTFRDTKASHHTAFSLDVCQSLLIPLFACFVFDSIMILRQSVGFVKAGTFYIYDQCTNDYLPSNK